MKLTIKLNLDVLVATSFSDTFYFEFTNITNLQHWYDEENVTQLEFEQSSLGKRLYVFDDGATSPTYHEENGDIVTLSENSDYIIFTCEITSYVRLMEFIQKGIIEVNQNGNTTIFVYKQNSENDAVNKTLTFVDAIDGKFNQMIGLKNVNLDIKGYARNYNYIYIPSLNRYYYVDSVELVSADYSRLHLKEDVLMSWRDLIKLQLAFVTRSEDIYDPNIVDDRLPLESVKTIDYFVPTRTSVGNKENITLKGNFDASESNFMISVNNDVQYTKSNITTPDTALPTISPVQSTYNVVYFTKLARMNSLMKALISESNLASSINAIIFLPFVPTNAFNVSYSNPLMVGLPTSKALCDDDKFHYLYDIPSGHIAFPDIGRTSYGTSPYLVLADIQMEDLSDDWYKHEPYTNYEIYIPFVGWIKVDSTQISGKRLLIYYTIDFNTGNATAYLYNYTNGKILYSCTCQLGVKLDVLSSNALELSREKQANELNTLIGLLASAVSIGAGVVSENPVAIAGGVLSAGKTIASAVNKERMMFERAQVTYGSGDAGLHSNLNTMIRVTYNKQKPFGYELSRYYHMQGRPANTYTYLSVFDGNGYVEVGEIHFDPQGYDIYQDEISEIVDLLQKGVIF